MKIANWMLLLGAGVWLSTGNGGIAQDTAPIAGDPAPQEKETAGPKVRFAVWGDWKGKELYVKRASPVPGKESPYLKLDLLNLAYSPEIPFKRSEALALCVKEGAEDAPVFRPVMNVAIPLAIRSPLVLVFPDEKGGASFRFFDLDPAAFPYGGYQIVNLSKVPLLARLDEKEVRIDSGMAKLMSGAGEPEKNMWLRVAMPGENNASKLIYSAMLKNRNGKRMFLFFHPSGSGADSTVSVKTLVDFVQESQPQ